MMQARGGRALRAGPLMAAMFLGVASMAGAVGGQEPAASPSPPPAADPAPSPPAAAPASAPVEEAVPDTFKPDVSIRRLGNDSTVSGMLTLEVTAQDATPITTVSARIGTTDLGILTGSPAVYRFDTTQLPNGKLELIATAADSAGNVGTKKVRLRVDNGPAPHPQGPVVTLTPATGTEVQGTVTFEATIQSPIAIKSVKAFSGRKASGSLSKPPWTFNVDASWMEPADLTFRVQATDAEGRMGRGVVTVRVNNPDTKAPTAEIRKPKAGDKVSGVSWVEVQARDERDLKEVQLLADGKPVATRESGRFGVQWDTNDLSAGKHSLTVRAVDGGGNETVTPVTEVEVVPFPASIEVVSTGSMEARKARWLQVEWAAGAGAGFERVDLLVDGELATGRAYSSPTKKGKVVLRMDRLPAGAAEVSVRGRLRSQRFVESARRSLGGKN